MELKFVAHDRRRVHGDRPTDRCTWRNEPDDRLQHDELERIVDCDHRCADRQAVHVDGRLLVDDDGRRRGLRELTVGHVTRAPAPECPLSRPPASQPCVHPRARRSSAPARSRTRGPTRRCRPSVRGAAECRSPFRPSHFRVHGCGYSCSYGSSDQHGDDASDCDGWSVRESVVARPAISIAVFNCEAVRAGAPPFPPFVPDGHAVLR